MKSPNRLRLVGVYHMARRRFPSLPIRPKGERYIRRELAARATDSECNGLHLYYSKSIAKVKFSSGII